LNVQTLSKEKTSLLNRYKNLIALRNNEKVLQYGSYDRLEYKEDQMLFTRSFEGDKITVLINFGTEKKVALPSGAQILLGKTTLKSNSYIIYRN
jgi:trehalose-6-phosphate hydrolase